MSYRYSLVVRVNENMLDRSVALMDERGLLEDSKKLRDFKEAKNRWYEVKVILSDYLKDRVLNSLNGISGVVYSCIPLPCK